MSLETEIRLAVPGDLIFDMRAFEQRYAPLRPLPVRTLRSIDRQGGPDPEEFDAW